MDTKKLEKKIQALKNKVAKQVENLNSEIYTICENMDYQNSSRFSYNIDKLKQFNEYLQEFQIIDKKK
jgi:hypothetical protein